jgi:hypothetical protein
MGTRDAFESFLKATTVAEREAKCIGGRGGGGGHGEGGKARRREAAAVTVKAIAMGMVRLVGLLNKGCVSWARVGVDEN